MPKARIDRATLVFTFSVTRALPPQVEFDLTFPELELSGSVYLVMSANSHIVKSTLISKVKAQMRERLEKLIQGSG